MSWLDGLWMMLVGARMEWDAREDTRLLEEDFQKVDQQAKKQNAEKHERLMQTDAHYRAVFLTQQRYKEVMAHWETLGVQVRQDYKTFANNHIFDYEQLRLFYGDNKEIQVPQSPGSVAWKLYYEEYVPIRDVTEHAGLIPEGWPQFHFRREAEITAATAQDKTQLQPPPPPPPTSSPWKGRK